MPMAISRFERAEYFRCFMSTVW